PGSGHAAPSAPDAPNAPAPGAPGAARQRVAATPPGAGSAATSAGSAATPLGSAADAGPLPREAVIVLGLSGRGDKDLAALAEADGRKVTELGGAQLRASSGLKEVGR
ncbi:MAG TPA: hypothetical protein VF375_05975, partial [Candidatus Limnocylindrales bacterium]